jgi:hypothetical protein
MVTLWRLLTISRFPHSNAGMASPQLTTVVCQMAMGSLLDLNLNKITWVLMCDQSSLALFTRGKPGLFVNNASINENKARHILEVLRLFWDWFCSSRKEHMCVYQISLMHAGRVNANSSSPLAETISRQAFSVASRTVVMPANTMGECLCHLEPFCSPKWVLHDILNPRVFQFSSFTSSRN